jgi:peptidyl-prolyl cis-trans isomerase NIMA-interacting 1
MSPRSFRPHVILLAFLLVGLGLATGCARPKASSEPATSEASTSAATSLPSDEQLAGPVAVGPALSSAVAAAPSQAAAAPERIAARHILVAWQGAKGARTSIHRTKEEALARAGEVLVRARAGQDFASLAKEYSDDPSGPRGGFLGGFSRGVMVKAFEDAAFALPVDGTSDLVETAYGYHIIRREPLQEIHVAEILIQWKDIQGTKARRSKDEARSLADQAVSRLRAGATFDDVARELSDGPLASRGGDLGWFSRGQFRPDFEDAAFSLRPGETSDVVESSVGFHVIRRLE